MQKVEKHVVRKGDALYCTLDTLSFRAKNLYNSALYSVRQYFFKTSKYKHHNQVINDFTQQGQADYVALPRKLSQQTIRLVGQNFRSFFGLLALKNASGYDKQVRIPSYLPKRGRYVITFPRDTISKKSVEVSDGLYEHTLCSRDLNLKVRSRVLNPDMVRVVPRGNHYVVEVVYTVPDVVMVPRWWLTEGCFDY